MASTSSGACRKCERVIAKTQMTRHLKRCLGPARSKGQYLIVVDMPGSPYWVYFTAPKNVTLDDIDFVLRDMWVECCQHMSEFSVNNVHFVDAPEPTLPPALDGLFPARYVERPKSVTLKHALQVGSEFTYEYDFGSTTELRLRVLDDQITGINGGIAVAARNEAPEVACVKCGQPATALSVEDWEPVPYCKTCLGPVEEMWVPLINSPRTGVCGYEGPSVEP